MTEKFDWKAEQHRKYQDGPITEKEYKNFLRLVEEGVIQPATKRVHWEMPPKFPGKPLSEYVKEMRGR